MIWNLYTLFIWSLQGLYANSQLNTSNFIEFGSSIVHFCSCLCLDCLDHGTLFIWLLKSVRSVIWPVQSLMFIFTTAVPDLSHSSVVSSILLHNLATAKLLLSCCECLYIFTISARTFGYLKSKFTVHLVIFTNFYKVMFMHHHSCLKVELHTDFRLQPLCLLFKSLNIFYFIK